MVSLTKIVLIIVFVIGIIFAGIYYMSREKEASFLQVQVVVEGDNNSATIQNISAHLEQVHKISEPKGTLLITPGVTVVVLQNMSIIGLWTSVPYNGTGIYNLTVGLIKYPKPGENVSVVARVMNERSENIAVTSKAMTLT